MASAPVPPSREEIELLIERLLATAGPGRILACGEGTETLVKPFALRGIDCVSKRRLPGASGAGEAERYDIIVLWHVLDGMDAAACAATLASIRPMASRAVLVRTDSRGRHPGPRGEKWVEQPAIEAGYCKHPLYLQLAAYEDLEHEGSEDLLLFQPIPEPLLARHPLSSLAAERDLHMDMLREAGRRSDAHVERYRLALQLIRPGDTIVDVACGLGYGSRVLYAGGMASHVIGIDESESAVSYATDIYGLDGRVEFRRGDAQDLGFLPDHSVDLVVSFETLEHLHEPLRLLAEAKRVLRPGGRLIACVPNKWVDESGTDPNPHHHHVYTWERLKGEVSSLFRLERAFRQVAGAGMVLTKSPRLLREFDLHDGPGEAEWLIAVAMSDPVEGASVPFAETTFTGYDAVEDFHVARFAEGYANPWLVKAIVSIGFRFEDRSGLVDIARQVRKRSPRGSPDEGAALCIEAYAALENGGSNPKGRDRIRKDLRRYVEEGGSGPHQLRWVISNLYVLGLLHLADRDWPEARRCLERCAAMDPGPFSPLLGTKTIGAAYLAGLLAAQAGDHDAARSLWIGAIRSVRALFSADWTNVIGRDDHPLYFGLAEVGIAVSKASKCAYALSAIECLRDRPGRFWVEVSRDVESETQRQSLALRHMASTLSKAGQPANNGTAGQAAVIELQSALARQGQSISEMRRAFEEQARTIAGLQEQVLERDMALAKQAQTLSAQRDSFEAQAHNIAGLQQQILERDAAIEAQARILSAQREAFEAQANNIAALHAPMNERDAALAKQGQTIAEMHRAFEEQAQNIAKLNAALLQRDSAFTAQSEALAAQRAAFAMQAESVAALQDQVSRRDEALGRQNESILAMHATFEQQAKNIDMLEGSLLSSRGAFAEMQASLAAQAENIAALHSQAGKREEALARQAETIASFRAQISQLEAALAKQGETISMLHSQIAQREHALARQGEAISSFRGEIANRETALAKQGETISGMQAAFEQQARNIGSLRSALLDKEAEFATQADNVAALHAQIGKRDEALLRQADTIREMRAEFDQQEANIEELKAGVSSVERERDALAQRLQRSESSREALQGSLSAIQASWPYRLLRRWIDRGSR